MRFDTVAVPHEAEPATVPEPPEPTEGVTVTVIVRVPEVVGLNSETVMRLQLCPLARTWFAEHRPEDGAAAYVNWLLCPETLCVVDPSLTAPPVAVTLIVPEQARVVPTPVELQLTEDTDAVPEAAAEPVMLALEFVPLVAFVVRVTVRLPEALGVKEIVPRLQDEPGLTVAPPHAPAPTEKSLACEPESDTGFEPSTTRPFVAVIDAVPEQFAARPTVLEHDTFETLRVAVPKLELPVTVLLPAVPLAGVTVTVIVRVPEAVGLNWVTEIKLQLDPAVSVWPFEHAPEDAAAYVN